MDKKKLLFVEPLIRALSQGPLLVNIFFFATRALAVIIALGGFAAWCMAWKEIGQLDGAAILGGILFQVAFLISLYTTAHILWIRAGDMRTASDADYKVIPVVSVAYRMVAEVIAAFYVIIGLGGFLFLLIASSQAFSLLRELPLPISFSRGDNNFIAAIGFLVWMLGCAILVLASGYLVAEVTKVIVDIARNTRAIAENSPSSEKKPTA